MPIIYIPVEVDDSLVEQILGGQQAAVLLGAQEVSTTQPVPPTAALPVPPTYAAPRQYERTESEFGYTVAPVQADPWASPATSHPAPAPTPVPTQQASGVQPTGPVCAHGAMIFRPAGFSKANNKPYPAFWACPTQRGAPDKCPTRPV